MAITLPYRFCVPEDVPKLEEPIIVNKLPSNVRLPSATAAFVVPSDVNNLLSDGFEIVSNPVPLVPEEPADPDDPDEPEVPVDPDVPDEPEVPVDPDVPDEPEVPVDPEDPVDPEVPDEPEDPEVPDEPADPEVPAEPSPPVVPSKFIVKSGPFGLPYTYLTITYISPVIGS